APLRDGHITRVETLGGKYLYAINVYPAVGSFDLCPADACQTTNGVELVRGACAIDAPKSGMRVERADPPAHIIAEVERIAQAAKIDVGGIEYLVDDRDGQHYFYDVNALSNFVADAINVVGFDPFERLVDYLAERAGVLATVEV
ncbi:RimK family alpha-L-glutamate ligase, partial [Gemmatimonas sp.]|uniref:ATP-grasp domain-containing protein n=1 Tax=Gemmatimonas sp. TaxID=1962908 RepID=UPI0039832490